MTQRLRHLDNGVLSIQNVLLSIDILAAAPFLWCDPSGYVHCTADMTMAGKKKWTKKEIKALELQNSQG